MFDATLQTITWSRFIMHQQTLDRRFPDSHGYVEIPDVYEDHTDGH